MSMTAKAVRQQALPEDNPVKVALKEIVKKLNLLKSDPCYVFCRQQRVFSVPEKGSIF